MAILDGHYASGVQPLLRELPGPPSKRDPAELQRTTAV